jgi:hypothetical protein
VLVLVGAVALSSLDIRKYWDWDPDPSRLDMDTEFEAEEENTRDSSTALTIKL